MSSISCPPFTPILEVVTLVPDCHEQAEQAKVNVCRLLLQGAEFQLERAIKKRKAEEEAKSMVRLIAVFVERPIDGEMNKLVILLDADKIDIDEFNEAASTGCGVYFRELIPRYCKMGTDNAVVGWYDLTEFNTNDIWTKRANQVIERIYSVKLE